MKRLAGDELGIRHVAPVRRAYPAVLDHQAVGRHVETRRGHADQYLAHLRRRIHDRGAAVLHRIAARGVALVGRARCVSGDQPDACRADDELFRGELNERRLDALPELDLAGKDGDGSVRVDANPGVEQRRVLEASRKNRRPDFLRSLRGSLARQQREANYQGAGAGDELAPR